MTTSHGYNKLDLNLQEQIQNDRKEHKINPYAFVDEKSVRRESERDKSNLWRPTFVRDIEKTLHLPLYNRYGDKTQVFSFRNNDDLTRRALHVQLVSRIARNIGTILNLNLDLIEAIALSHDIGHTPFGHAGERFLNELYHNETGRYFFHNVHSVRVLDKLSSRNFTLQTLDGALCHNGELEQIEYHPQFDKTFNDHDKEVELCYAEGKHRIDKLTPSTLEGCIVKISDLIAYIGKDRQDAVTAKIIPEDQEFTTSLIGTDNARIINNLSVDIMENSYGKNYITMSKNAFDDLSTAKKENYELIYKNKNVNDVYDEKIKPMFSELYQKLLQDVKKQNENSVIYKHHIDFWAPNIKHYQGRNYSEDEPNQIVVDYIASMTDDYFIDLHNKLFPGSLYRIQYESYFEDIK